MNDLAETLLVKLQYIMEICLHPLYLFFPSLDWSSFTRFHKEKEREMKLRDFLFALKPLFATVVCVISVAIIAKILSIRFFDKKSKYHPVAGTVIHQLFNFTRLLDYMIDRTNHRKTYRLLSFKLKWGLHCKPC